MIRSSRRLVCLAACVAIVATACARKPSEARCAHCGMKIDPASPWRAELVGANDTRTYDSPRCALAAAKHGDVPGAKLRVQEFYERAWVDAAAVKFVVGSDVVGPMGPDAVPVDVARAAKFAADHQGKRVLGFDEITPAILGALE